MKFLSPHSAALITLLFAHPALSQTTAPALPFSVSQETTRITAPLRPDGTIDFPAALNQKYSQNVTPENNGFVLFLQVAGTGDNLIIQKVKPDFLKALGTSMLPPDAQTWETYGDFIKRTKKIDNVDPFYDELTAAYRAPWLPQDHPDLAAYLKSNQRLLDLTTQAVQRPKWWIPATPADGQTLMSSLLPALGIQRDVANSLCARATMRAATGDFDGFLADIKAVRQFARHNANGNTLIERLVGIALEARAANAAGSVAAQGKLSADQCRAALRSWDELPPLPSVADALDNQERFVVVDTIQWLALGRLDLLGNLFESDDGNADFKAISRQDVDWNSVLKTVQGVYDDQVKAFSAPSISQFQSDLRNARTRFDAPETDAPDVEMKPRPQESRADYTNRVTHFLLSGLVANVGRADIERRGVNMQSAMVRTLLAAAQYQARTNHWPAALADLLPTDLKQIPKDIHSANNAGTQPLLYTLTPTGPRLYSTGEGTRDLGIGAPKPASAPPAPPPNNNGLP